MLLAHCFCDGCQLLTAVEKSLSYTASTFSNGARAAASGVSKASDMAADAWLERQNKQYCYTMDCETLDGHMDSSLGSSAGGGWERKSTC